MLAIRRMSAATSPAVGPQHPHRPASLVFTTPQGTQSQKRPRGAANKSELESQVCWRSSPCICIVLRMKISQDRWTCVKRRFPWERIPGSVTKVLTVRIPEMCCNFFQVLLDFLFHIRACSWLTFDIKTELQNGWPHLHKTFMGHRPSKFTIWRGMWTRLIPQISVYQTSTMFLAW